ncbi:MAG: tetratricopeptide repeat protein [Clostridia bacterium]
MRRCLTPATRHLPEFRAMLTNHHASPVSTLVLSLLHLALLAMLASPGLTAAGSGGARASPRVESRVDWSAIVEANVNRPPDDLEGRLYLAIAYANQGMIKEAAREFRTIESAGYEEFGREVIARAEQALDRDPDDIVSLNLVGFAYYAFSDFERSAECLEKLVALDPRNIWTRHYFAVSLSKIGEIDRAIEVLRAALSLDPSNEYTHLLLGLAYKEKGWYILSVLELARAGRAVRELSTLK